MYLRSWDARQPALALWGASQRCPVPLQRRAPDARRCSTSWGRSEGPALAPLIRGAQGTSGRAWPARAVACAFGPRGPAPDWMFLCELGRAAGGARAIAAQTELQGGASVRAPDPESAGGSRPACLASAVAFCARGPSRQGRAGPGGRRGQPDALGLRQRWRLAHVGPLGKAPRPAAAAPPTAAGGAAPCTCASAHQCQPTARIRPALPHSAEEPAPPHATAVCPTHP